MTTPGGHEVKWREPAEARRIRQALETVRAHNHQSPTGAATGFAIVAVIAAFVGFVIGALIF